MMTATRILNVLEILDVPCTRHGDAQNCDAIELESGSFEFRGGRWLWLAVGRSPLAIDCDDDLMLASHEF